MNPAEALNGRKILRHPVKEYAARRCSLDLESPHIDRFPNDHEAPPAPTPPSPVARLEVELTPHVTAELDRIGNRLQMDREGLVARIVDAYLVQRA